MGPKEIVLDHLFNIFGDLDELFTITEFETKLGGVILCDKDTGETMTFYYDPKINEVMFIEEDGTHEISPESDLWGHR